MVRKSIKFGIAACVAALSLGVLMAESNAQVLARRQQSLEPAAAAGPAPSYYNFAPGYYDYVPNPALSSFGPPDSASCGGFHC
jgi:hypothetical protein